MHDLFKLIRNRALRRSSLLFLVALVLLTVCLAGEAAAQAADRKGAPFKIGSSEERVDPWNSFVGGWSAFREWKFLLRLLTGLIVAVGLAASIAYHPKSVGKVANLEQKVANLEQLEQPHTFLMYAVVGVIVANLVVVMPEMAFVVFGIGGLLRFRTDVGPARNTGKVILVTLVGLACGLDLFALAFLGTAFSWLLIYILESKVAYRVVINWVGSEKLQQATQAYKDVLVSAGYQVLSEKKNFGKAQASFIFRTPTKVTREELDKLLAGIPKELQGSLDWETT